MSATAQLPPAILAQLRMDLPLLVRTMLRAHDAQAAAERRTEQAEADNPKVFTVWQDHRATGEQRQFMGLIVHALNREAALEHFGKEFGPQFAQGAEIAQGAVRNAVTTFLWSERVFSEAARLAAQHGAGATPLVTGRYVFNLA